MPNYSTTTGVPVGADRNLQFVPFKIEARAVPSVEKGRRVERIRSLEKIAQKVEDALQGDTNFVNNGMAREVAFSPQFGQFWDKVTVIGFWRRSPTPEKPAADVVVIHSGTAPKEKTASITGNKGGSLNWGQEPTAQTTSDLRDLLQAFESALTNAGISGLVEIKMVDFNGIKFGTTADNGFRTLPTV